MTQPAKRIGVLTGGGDAPDLSNSFAGEDD